MTEMERDPTESGDVFALDFPATLTAVVRAEAGGGFSARVPALPGCITEADSIVELRDNLREAAEGWVKAMTGLVSAGGAESRAGLASGAPGG